MPEARPCAPTRAQPAHVRKVAPVATQHMEQLVERYPAVPVRYLPLGSPWAVPNQLYSTCGGCGSSVAGGVYQGWCGMGGYLGGVYRVGYYPCTHPYTRILVLPGPNHVSNSGSAPTQALQGPCWTPPHTWAPRTQKGEIQGLFL